MRAILLAAAALLASAAAAQAPQPPAPELALPPRYEVEILIFAHLTFDGTEERFDFAPNGFGADDTELREPPVFDETTFNPPVVPLTPEPLAPVDPVAEQRAAALQVVMLRPEELKLGNEFRKLRGLAAYRPLVHAGWVQPGLPETDATPFNLHTLGVLNPRGTVRVHLSRFLHITLDVTYVAEAGAAPVAGGVDGLDELALAPQYRLSATRSARSNELHYFDHPAFGVLVRVTPVPAQSGGAERRPAA
jgi:hypothetical protein